MRNRAQLWNAVERVEKRKDAQLARDLVLSLPHELNHEQRRDLVREFVGAEFVAKGMIADAAIHAPDRRGDDRNHHAHVMLTMRELTGDGFGNKVRAWNQTEQLEQWRESWAATVNNHLELHGHEARVDHRALADQGVDREPEPKQGPVATKIEREGRRSKAGDDRREVQARNEQRAEISAELAAVTAKIIDLAEERAKRAGEPQPAPSAEREAPERTEPEVGDQERERSSVGTTKGGMVAQQMEALDRFRQNSKSLEERRQERLRMLDQAVDQQAERAREDRAAMDRARQRGEPDR
jgi:ATP-dependent exoDNAse (exonuclease V) alpha subunit